MSEVSIDSVVVYDDTHRLYCAVYSSNERLLKNFSGLGMINFPRELHPVQMVGSRTRAMFEFHDPDSAIVLKVAHEIAEEMGIPLFVQLEQIYISEKGAVEAKPFEKYDPTNRTGSVVTDQALLGAIQALNEDYRLVYQRSGRYTLVSEIPIDQDTANILIHRGWVQSMSCSGKFMLSNEGHKAYNETKYGQVRHPHEWKN